MKRASTLFIADSGSTRHALSSRICLANYRVSPDHYLSTGSGKDFKVEGIGDLIVGVQSEVEHKRGVITTQIIPLKGVLYVPGLTSKLLS